MDMALEQRETKRVASRNAIHSIAKKPNPRIAYLKKKTVKKSTKLPMANLCRRKTRYQKKIPWEKPVKSQNLLRRCSLLCFLFSFTFWARNRRGNWINPVGNLEKQLSSVIFVSKRWNGFFFTFSGNLQLRWHKTVEFEAKKKSTKKLVARKLSFLRFLNQNQNYMDAEGSRVLELLEIFFHKSKRWSCEF